MNIGIIGSGHIGRALAKHLKKLGHEVQIANSRGPETLDEIVRETGAKAVTVDQAIASASDLLILAVPEAAIPDLPSALISKSTATIVDAGNYYPSRDGKIAEIENGSTESEWVSKVIGREVIKAFNNIVAPSLVAKVAPKGAKDRVALAIAGNDLAQRKSIMNLVEEIGFDTVDSGPLTESWRQQPGTPAYCQDMNAKQLAQALHQAERAHIAKYREAADEGARPYFVKK